VGDRLDDIYLADGDASEYDNLAGEGLVLLATDEPYRVADMITADDVGREACGR
jgi:glycerophosphoryl diester phosphodiesterase